MADNERVTPARPDLAAAHLKGTGGCAALCRGREVFRLRRAAPACGCVPATMRRRTASCCSAKSSPSMTARHGWAWGQAANDLYVGYVREDALAAPFAAEARVSALMAPVFSAADLKTPVRDMLPLNARVPVLAREGDYVNIGRRALCISAISRRGDAKGLCRGRRTLPGRALCLGRQDAAGLDCSGLIQTALAGGGQGRAARHRHDGKGAGRRRRAVRCAARRSGLLERPYGRDAGCNGCCTPTPFIWRWRSSRWPRRSRASRKSPDR